MEKYYKELVESNDNSRFLWECPYCGKKNFLFGLLNLDKEPMDHYCSSVIEIADWRSNENSFLSRMLPNISSEDLFESDWSQILK